MPAISATVVRRLMRSRRLWRAVAARRARERRRASIQGPGVARSVVGTANLAWGLTPTGLAVGLARRPALRRSLAAIRPRRTDLLGRHWVPRSPPQERQGL